MKILKELTTLDPNIGGGNILALDDPELFKYPVAYLCEAGFWTRPTPRSRGLRTYLLKGGFLIVDDFAGPQWANFEEQMRKVLPRRAARRSWTRRTPSSTRSSAWSRARVPPPLLPRAARRATSGVFEDNDPAKRLMVIVNYNHDLSEYWEWSDTGFVPDRPLQRGLQARASTTSSTG